MATQRHMPQARGNDTRFDQVSEGLFTGAPMGGRYTVPSGYRPGPGVAALLSTVVLVAGIWLVIAPSALGYGDSAAAFGARWHDGVVGLAIAVIALIRILSPAATAPLSIVNLALGGWLVAAPIVLDYRGAGESDATWNSIVVGGIVVLFAGTSWAAGSVRRRSSRARETHSERSPARDQSASTPWF